MLWKDIEMEVDSQCDWDRHCEWTVGVGNEWGWGQDDNGWVGKGTGTQWMSLTIVNEHGMESK